MNFFKKIQVLFFTKNVYYPDLVVEKSELEKGVQERTAELLQSQQKIIKTYRLYQFTSNINQMILRAADETTLFKEACKIAVNPGNFKLAWIGMTDEQTLQIIPVMYFGEEQGYLTDIRITSLDSTPEGTGPTGTSVREKRYVVCNDIENEGRMEWWRNAALVRGYKSSIALPIKIFDKVVGAISLYSGEKNFFDEAEIELLEKAALDISFALENFEKEKLRNKAEDAVKESEKRYQTLTEVSPVGIFHTDTNGFTTYVNPCWCTMSGMVFEEALGNGWLSAVHPEDRDRILNNWDDAQLKKEDSFSEYRFVRADGTIRWVIGQAIAERNTLGKVVGYVGTTTDITERKNSEQEIRIREERYRSLIEHASDGIFLADSEGRFLEVNDRGCQMVGYTLEECCQLEFDNLVYKDQNFIPYRFEELKAGKTIIQKRSLRRKDHTVFIVEISARQLHGGNILSIVRDLSERMEAEHKLQLEKDLSDKIINSLPGIFYLTDTTPRLLRWNKAFETISGYSSEELAAAVPISLFDPQDHLIMRMGIEKPHKQAIADVESSILTKEGKKIPYYFTGAVIEYEGKPAMLGTGIDISERKEAEEKIKVANERFELIARATNDIIWDWNLLTDELWWNDNFYKLFGFENTDGLPQISMWSNNIHPDDLKRVLNNVGDAIKSGKKYWNDEYRYVKSDGNIIVVYDRGFILHDKAGKPYRMIGSMLDITERKRIENEIIESEEKYRTLVEQASDAIFIADKTGRFINVNSVACKMVQVEEKEMLQKSIYDFTITEDLQRNPFHFEELKQGKTVMTERIIRDKEGKVKDVEITAKLLSDGRLLCFVRDISERKKVQMEILKEKNLSDSIINSLPGIFYLISQEGQFLRWNNNFEKVSLYNSDEIKSMHPFDFFDHDEKEIIAQTIRRVFKHGEEKIQANFLLKSAKKIPYYFTGKAIEYEGNTCLVGVGIDFSERVRVQEEIKQTSDKLRQLTAHLINIREEERKRIGSEIHDELGQQLTAIKMDVAWIDKQITADAATLKLKLKNIIKLLDSSNQSIRRILSELRPYILDNYGLPEALKWLGQQFTENTGITVSLSTDDATLKFSDPLATCVFRVYQEALTNITRYAHASAVATSLHKMDERLIFSVEDNGKGFDVAAALKEKTFGLLGMRERVISIGGKFEIASTPVSGTKIVASLIY